MKFLTRLAAVIFTCSISISSTRAAGDSNTAEYEVIFRARWSAETHPRDFPASAHWSGLVGGLHNRRVIFWRNGTRSSQGIQAMAERGNQSTLLSEVDAAIAEGTADQGLAGGGLGSGAGLVRLRFTAKRSHSFVTLTSMIAPSPDWFVGVHGLPLRENGAWVKRKVVRLYPYDAGTDSGRTFTSANAVTEPRGVTHRIATAPLAPRAVALPMGSFTFVRLDNATPAAQ